MLPTLNQWLYPHLQGPLGDDLDNWLVTSLSTFRGAPERTWDAWANGMEVLRKACTCVRPCFDTHRHRSWAVGWTEHVIIRVNSCPGVLAKAARYYGHRKEEN